MMRKIFHRGFQGNTQMLCILERAMPVDLEPIWEHLQSFIPTKRERVCKLISPFTMNVYGSLYDYIIHIELIAISHISLITSSSALHVPP